MTKSKKLVMLALGAALFIPSMASASIAVFPMELKNVIPGQINTVNVRNRSDQMEVVTVESRENLILAFPPVLRIPPGETMQIKATLKAPPEGEVLKSDVLLVRMQSNQAALGVRVTPVDIQ